MSTENHPTMSAAGRPKSGPTPGQLAVQQHRMSILLPCSPPTLPKASIANVDDLPTDLKRHSDLWFDDGSVICQAEDTLFKVHVSQLARHSIFFRDMFSLPQPEPGSTFELPLHVEGRVSLPVIHLYDKAEDVGSLFTALYDGPTFGCNSQEDFRVVSGILRLSTKYLIDSLRAKALMHLSIAWPLTLKAWDLREDLARKYETETESSSHSRLYPHPIDIINLAREVDAPSLLPSAFYDLSRYTFTQILESTDEDILFRPLPTCLSNLAQADMQRLCLGKEVSQQAITALITAMGNSQNVRSSPLSSHLQMRGKGKGFPGSVCVSAAACRKDFSELVDLATQHYIFDRERGCHDPLYVAEELGQLKGAEFSECKACAKSLENWAMREREKIWRSIPIWFRLDY